MVKKDWVKGGAILIVVCFIIMLFTEPRSIESSTRPSLKYGEMWNYTSNLSAWDFEFAQGSDIYHNLSNLSAGRLDGFDYIDTGGEEGGSQLVAQYSGIYRVNWHISCSSDDNKDLHGFMPAINGDKETARNCYARRDFTNKNKVGSVAGSCLIYLNVGDAVNMLLENEVDVDGLNIHTVNVNLIRVDR